MGFGVTGPWFGKDISVALSLTRNTMSLPVGLVVDDEEEDKVNFEIAIAPHMERKLLGLNLTGLSSAFDVAHPLMKRMSALSDDSWSLDSNHAMRTLNRELLDLMDYKKKVTLPANYLRSPDHLQNRKLLPFHMAGLSSEVATIALKNKLPAYHPVVLAIADGTITEKDIPAYQGLPITLLGELLCTAVD